MLTLIIFLIIVLAISTMVKPNLVKKNWLQIALSGITVIFLYAVYSFISDALSYFSIRADIILLVLAAIFIATWVILSLSNTIYRKQLQQDDSLDKPYRVSSIIRGFALIRQLIYGTLIVLRQIYVVFIILIFVSIPLLTIDAISSALNIDSLKSLTLLKDKTFTENDIIPLTLLDISPEMQEFVKTQPYIDEAQAREQTEFFLKYIRTQDELETFFEEVKKYDAVTSSGYKLPYNTIERFFTPRKAIIEIGMWRNESAARRAISVFERTKSLDISDYLLSKGFTPRQTANILTSTADKLKISGVTQQAKVWKEAELDRLNSFKDDPIAYQKKEDELTKNIPFISNFLVRNIDSIYNIVTTIRISGIVIKILYATSILVITSLTIVLPILIFFGMPNPSQIYTNLADTRNPTISEQPIIQHAYSLIKPKNINLPKIDGIRVISLSTQNAYVIGKTIVLHKGLLVETNPNHIAAVIAHELAHIQLKHTRITSLALPPIPVIKRQFEYEADNWVALNTNQGENLAEFLSTHDFFDLEPQNNKDYQPYKDTPIIGGRTHPENELRRDRIYRALKMEPPSQVIVYPEFEPRVAGDMAKPNTRK